jgi:hypothetical protein
VIGDTKVPIQWASRIIALRPPTLSPPFSEASAHSTYTASLGLAHRKTSQMCRKSDLMIMHFLAGMTLCV